MSLVEICNSFNCTPKELTGSTRKRNVYHARITASYVLTVCNKMKQQDVANLLQRNQSNISRSLSAFYSKCRTDKDFQIKLNHLSIN